MPCYFPLQANFSLRGDGKKDIKFSNSSAKLFQLGVKPLGDNNLSIPCGRCMGCRLEKSRQWAVRCMHEAKCFEDNCFITLTYAVTPEHGSLTNEPSDFTLFMKRLRKRFPDIKIRYFMCGEYGERGSRPHYHACLFNFDFPDKQLFRRSPSGSLVYRSKVLEELWPFGFSSIGEVNFNSGKYTIY